MEIPDITKLSWPLNVALIGAVFSVFALIYNIHYIYYGFMTFILGILCHLIDTAYNFWLKEEGWRSRFVFIFQFLLIVLWIMVLLRIYN